VAKKRSAGVIRLTAKVKTKDGVTYKELDCPAMETLADAEKYIRDNPSKEAITVIREVGTYKAEVVTAVRLTRS